MLISKDKSEIKFTKLFNKNLIKETIMKITRKT